jgi:hypothetical protein
VRAEATTMMLRDVARQASEAVAEEVARAAEEAARATTEEERTVHWAAELNAAFARRETQRKENRRRARRQEAAIWVARAERATLDEDDDTGGEV